MTQERTTQTDAPARDVRPSGAASPASPSVGAQVKQALRGHDYATQVQMLRPGGGAPRPGDVQEAAASGMSGGGGSLPYAQQIQRSFGGYDISNVQAHTDAAAANASASMGAAAYASGNHVVLGDKGRDLHTVAHEAAHVVQQRAGASLSGGVGRAGDPYERHADAVADLVVQGKSAEGLLGELAGSGGGGGVQMRAGDASGGVSADGMCLDPGAETASMEPATQDQNVGGASARADESNGLTIFTGETTSFDIGLNLPIFGPVKLEAKVGGSYSQKRGGGKRVVEVEGFLYGGILIDLIIVKIRAGMEGRVKFTVEGEDDLMGAVKRGLEEIVQFRVATDLVPKVASAKRSIETHYYDYYTGRFKHHMQRLREQIKSEKDLDAATRWTFSKSPREWAEEQVELWNSAVIGRFDMLGADVEVVQSELAPVGPLAAALDAVAHARGVEEALGLVDAALGVGIRLLSNSKMAALDALGKIDFAPNDPKVGFTASIAFKAGVSAQLGKKASADLEVSAVSSIGDKVGETKWNTEAQKSEVVTGRLRVPPWAVSMSGTFRPETVDVSGSFLNEQSSMPPAAAQQTVAALAPAFKGLGSALRLAGSPIDAARSVVTAMGGVLSSQRAAFEDPAAIAARRGGKTTGSVGIQVDPRFTFERGSGQVTGGSLKLTLISMRMSAERYLGPAAAVGVSGNVSVGSTFEVSW